MKGTWIIILFLALIAGAYFWTESNRPKEFDWDMTLTKGDKNPYGTYILFKQLKDIFPVADIKIKRQTVYELMNTSERYDDSVITAYLLIEPNLHLSEDDVSELLNYAAEGNYVFVAADHIGTTLLDSLGIEIAEPLSPLFKDSISVKLLDNDPVKKRYTITRRVGYEQYFKKTDTTITTVLGDNQLDSANFVKVYYGDGIFFIHTMPVCFSNHFLLDNNHAEYTAKALSYMPDDIGKIYWDEYYKLGRDEKSRSPMRFILSNPYLKWAYYIAIVTLLLFAFFEMKRVQRIIPVIKPLGNSTLDFIGTVSGLYFNRKNNKNIAQKKINHFWAFVRNTFYINTEMLDDDFVQQLTQKSGVDEATVRTLIHVINRIEIIASVSDSDLLNLNKQINMFYKPTK